jgi:hypothetical protein
MAFSLPNLPGNMAEYPKSKNLLIYAIEMRLVPQCRGIEGKNSEHQIRFEAGTLGGDNPQSDRQRHIRYPRLATPLRLDTQTGKFAH